MKKRWADVKERDRVVFTVTAAGLDDLTETEPPVHWVVLEMSPQRNWNPTVDPDAQVEVAEGPNAEQSERQWHAALNAACTCGAAKKIANGLLGTEGTCGACNVWNVMCGRGIRKPRGGEVMRVFPVNFWTKSRICSHRREFKKVLTARTVHEFSLLICSKCRHGWVLDKNGGVA